MSQIPWGSVDRGCLDRMSYKLIIFDLDGTLLDSFPWFQGVLSAMADKYGFERIGDVESMRGKTSHEIARSAERSALAVAPDCERHAQAQIPISGPNSAFSRRAADAVGARSRRIDRCNRHLRLRGKYAAGARHLGFVRRPFRLRGVAVRKGEKIQTGDESNRYAG